MTQASPNAAPRPTGFLTFTLHAHLPYVVNHGTWPHGMEWLHEAAAETYLPLLRALGNLERDNIRFNCNLNLSPILLEQLSHPVFIAEFPHYLTRKIVAAREDEAFFIQSGEDHLAETARFWYRFFSQALEDFNALDGNIIKGFRHFNDIGLIEIITCGATHGYMPLLGTDESVRAQIRTAVSTHIRHIGKHPKGIWAPECGYRPAGFWNYPVPFADGSPRPPGFDRIGVEQALSESDIDFFFVDTHLVEESQRIPSPYELLNGSVPRDPKTEQMTHGPTPQPLPALLRRRPLRQALRHHHLPPRSQDRRPGLVRRQRLPRRRRLPRLPQEALARRSPLLARHRLQGRHGRQAALLPSGSRRAHHATTPPTTSISSTKPSSPASTTTIPPDPLLPLRRRALRPLVVRGNPLARSHRPHPPRLRHRHPAHQRLRIPRQLPRAGFIAMHEGSWGAEGNNHVWMNPDTSWTYTHIYPAELYTRDVCTTGDWHNSPLGKRIVQQLCRELLLLESSDWQFLITTGAARDYAEIRFLTHNDQFNEIKTIYQTFEVHRSHSP